MRERLIRAGLVIGGLASVLGLFAFVVPITDAFNHVRPFVLLGCLWLLGVSWKYWPAIRRWFIGLIALNVVLIAGPAYRTAACTAPAGATHPPENVLLAPITARSLRGCCWHSMAGSSTALTPATTR